MVPLGEALRYVRRDLLRVVLAATCVTVGTAVFTLVLGAVDGVDRTTGQLLRGLGKSTLVVTRRGTELKTLAERQARSRRRAKPEDDARFLAGRLPEAPLVSTRVVRTCRARAGARRSDGVFLVGVNELFPALIDLAVDEGRFFSRTEVDEARPVAVLGPTLARGLFPGRSALGESLLLDERLFRVVGVFEERGTFLGHDLDKWVAVPVSAARRVEDDGRTEVLLGFGAGDDLVARQQEVQELLRHRHRLEPEAELDFEVMNQGNLLQLSSRLLRGALAFALAVGLMVLSVSAVGVMNTLLVSVDERLAEVGVHKAVGATNYQVLWLFLCESLVLVLAGGLTGMAVAAAARAGLQRFAGLDLELGACVYAVDWALMAVVGVVAGFYPALKGARLTVLECLRAQRL